MADDRMPRFAALSGIQGLPWSTLGPVQSGAYVEPMLEQYVRFLQVFSKLDVPNYRDQELDLSLVREVVQGIGHEIWSEIPSWEQYASFAVVPVSMVLTVSREQLSTLVAMTDAIGELGIRDHSSLIWVGWMEEGLATPEQVMAAADRVYGILGAVIEADRIGLLQVLYKPSATPASGLGAAITASTGVIIGAVLGLAIVCFLIYMLVQSSRDAQFRDKACFDQDGKFVAERPGCAKALDNIASNQALVSALAPLADFSRALGSGLKWAAVGLAVLVGGAVAWNITQSGRATRSARKRTELARL